jgi:molybdate transport system substrate-binding protein
VTRPHADRVRRRPLAAAAVMALLAVLAASACGDDGSAAPTDRSAAGSDLSGTLTISAAASLTEAFGQIDAAFTRANPGVTVTPNFDASSTLAAQILSGAPADGFAPADGANMARVADAGRIDGTPVVFARNSLAIVTEPGNPERIGDLADLATAGVVALCGPDVPCGRFATEVLERAGVAIPESSVTRGQNVKATLTAVTDGDAVAGIVYVTDAVAAGDAVDTVEIPEADNALATYPYGVVEGSTSSRAARAYGEFLLGDEARSILEDHGFLPPP